MIQDQNHSAYPVQLQEECPLYPGYGLSKKELFAAMAMQGLLSNSSNFTFSNTPEGHINVANLSIVFANELCKQLGIEP